MKRPESHIIETRSQKIFENIIPDDWVYRDLKPDYGNDYLVEIFEKRESTGKIFFVQLKGSTQAVVNDTFVKQFTLDNLNYYDSFALPVLIACVSVETKQVWGIWSNNLLNSRTLKENQKTITIELGKKFLINEDFFQNVSSKLSILNKINISTNTNNEIEKLLSRNINHWINEYYKDTVSVEFNNLATSLKINYTTIKNTEIEINISSFFNPIIVKNLTINEPFLHAPKFDKDIVNDFNKDILFAIAIKLAKYDIKGSLNILIQIIDKLDFSNNKKFFMLDPTGLLNLAKAKNELYLLNEFVKYILKLKIYDLFFFFDLAYFRAESSMLSKYRIDNLHSAITTEIEEEFIGICHYNLGNIYRSMNKYNKSIYYYFKARKIYPEYLKRNYWWREVAGLLFLKGHYYWAEKFYKKSLESFTELGKYRYARLEKGTQEPYLVDGLIGDCLFFQSKFKEANTFFENYLKSHKKCIQEWNLKNLVCIELMDGDFNNTIFYKQDSLEMSENAHKLTSNKKAIETLENALKLHPLSGFVWFNLAVILNKEQQFNKSLFAFLMTGLIQDKDKEAQFNALILSMEYKESLLIPILLFLKEKHGDLIINDLSNYLMKKEISFEHKKAIINAFQEVLDGC